MRVSMPGGKIVIIFDHEAAGDGRKFHFQWHGKHSLRHFTGKNPNAQAHGAVGVLIVVNLTAIIRQIGTHGPHRRLDYPLLPCHRKPSLMMNSISRPPSFPTLREGHPGSCRRHSLRIAIVNRPQPEAAITLLPDTRILLHFRNSSATKGVSYNVVGLLEGSDLKLKAETILISAHHDHDGMSGSEIWHGRR